MILITIKQYHPVVVKTDKQHFKIVLCPFILKRTTLGTVATPAEDAKYILNEFPSWSVPDETIKKLEAWVNS